MKNPGKQKKYPLSVVIATLGGDILANTIACLNKGHSIPFEILVCIPEDESSKVEKLTQENVKIIKTPCRGQVAQRVYGLQHISQPMVLQMDEDVELMSADLYVLVQALGQLGRGHALAPLFRHLSSGQYTVEYARGVFGGLQSLYASLICGAPWGVKRMGVISPAGIGYGVDRRYCEPGLFETQWLPGGCVICHREDLVTEDYYPFAGKAFCEDLVHSVLWKKQGTRLWMHLDALGTVSYDPMPFNWQTKESIFRVHEYIVKLIGGNYWQLRLWHVVHISKEIILIGFRRIMR
jgi:glycosyltransferase involved in cell wall biosynthesis